mgnify:CR=1 FL=1
MTEQDGSTAVEQHTPLATEGVAAEGGATCRRGRQQAPRAGSQRNEGGSAAGGMASTPRT